MNQIPLDSLHWLAGCSAAGVRVARQDLQETHKARPEPGLELVLASGGDYWPNVHVPPRGVEPLFSD